MLLSFSVHSGSVWTTRGLQGTLSVVMTWSDGRQSVALIAVHLSPETYSRSCRSTADFIQRSSRSE